MFNRQLQNVSLFQFSLVDLNNIKSTSVGFRDRLLILEFEYFLNLFIFSYIVRTDTLKKTFQLIQTFIDTCSSFLLHQWFGHLKDKTFLFVFYFFHKKQALLFKMQSMYADKEVLDFLLK